MSQNAQILDHLRTYGAITPIVALRDYGVFRLGARIYDLKQAGHQIATTIIDHKSKRFARYVLTKASDEKPKLL